MGNFQVMISISEVRAKVGLKSEGQAKVNELEGYVESLAKGEVGNP